MSKSMKLGSLFSSLWRKIRKPHQNEKKLQLFERKLIRVLKTDSFQEKNLSFKKQRLLKQRLLSKIRSLPAEERHSEDVHVLVQEIHKAALQVQLSLRSKVMLKEKIMNTLENGNVHQMAFGTMRRPKHFKLVMTSFLLLCFVFSSLFSRSLQVVQVTMAAHSTYIQEVYGQVFILRDGATFPALQGFSLNENDVIQTRDKSFVTIRFFDDSTSRLGQNTKLELKRLYNEPFLNLSTQVEVLLGEGRLWTRVLNLVDDHSSFTVDTDQASMTATKKAAFDVQTHAAGSTLAVFDNVVDFIPKLSSDAQTKPIVAGFQADFSPENSKVVVVSPLSQDVANQSASQLWVESNLERDKVHAEKLVSEKENQLASTDNASGQTDAIQYDEDVDDKPFADALFEEQRVSFLGNYHAFLLGETFLMRNQGTDGLKLILQFQNSVRTFMIRFPSLVAADPLNAAVLRSLIQKKVAQQQKDLATFLPGDPLYPAKEALEEVELSLSMSEVDKAFVRLSQAERKLLEIQDLVSNHDMEMADRLLDRYQRQIDAIVLQLSPDHLSQLKGSLSAIFTQQVQQIKVLTALEKSLTGSDQTHLLLAVRKVRYTILNKLILALEGLPDAVSTGLLMELKDLLQTYLHENVRDEEFVLKLNHLLLLYGTNLGSQNDKVPQTLGMVTVVEEQATKPVDLITN